jgi:competence protein ComEC
MLLAAFLGLIILIAGGCRGFASAGGPATPLPTLAASARVSESSVLKIVIDRQCSHLADASDEYICLANSDSAAADMGSWVLRNVLGRSYNFPTGFRLAPGQTVKVHTGTGQDTPTDLHWAYRVNPAWDTTDKLTLLNNENVEVFISQPSR